MIFHINFEYAILVDNNQLELIFVLEEMCFKIKLPDREEFGLDEKSIVCVTVLLLRELTDEGC